MSAKLHRHGILILDFGSQYCHLIARRVREIGVYCEIHPYDVSPEGIRNFNPSGVILSGSPESAHSTDHQARAPQIVFALGCPVLGICYGMQTMAAQLGGGVQAAACQEFGYAKFDMVTESPLWGGLYADKQLDTWMSHGDSVKTLPEGFSVIGHTDNTPIAAMADETRRYYALQFHPEVTHTPQGTQIIKNFVFDICRCAAQWTIDNILEDLCADIRARVGRENVVLALSGGVDSSVLAALLHRAIGDQLTCIFVDNGLLRLHEAEQVQQTMARQMHVKLICVDAKRQFLGALDGITDPEQKRKTVGRVFIEVFEREATKLDHIAWLAQGTIYPDVIESAGAHTGKAKLIKSHHNVGGLPERLQLKLLEPLRELFKDEVRRLGVALGLEPAMIARHPFPGPGLAVRSLGMVREGDLGKLRLADAIFIEELRKAELYDQVSQAFAVFLPVSSVGVVGDDRCYEPVIALRAVVTSDFMTAHWAHLSHDFLSHVSNRIINEVRGISRVVYDISGNHPRR